ncbi:MAG: hypothetical protein IBJ11_12580 [Phycisphaerales bacterium]|nr:hypothetical protein [Phycisphaerales bacterium]
MPKRPARLAAAAMITLVALAPGCAHRTGAVAARHTTPEQQASMLDPLKALAGEWEVLDESGKPITAAVFAVTSGGSAVREIMFPGSPHEMTNLYHLDGPDLVMTHYCAVGNQPRMRAAESRQTPEGRVIPFRFDSVTNWAGPDQHYMGEMTLTIVDAGTIRQTWRSFAGKADHGPAVFTLRRKKTG